METIGLALIYIAWYLFVFAMCYIFSPWFAFLLIITPRFKEANTNSNDPKNSDEKGSDKLDNQ